MLKSTADLACCTVNGQNNRIIFLFSGQGSQYVGMAKALYFKWPWFRNGLEELFIECPQNKIIPLAEVMLGLNEHGSLLADTQYTQPILYALEIMLARVWSRWGVQADAVLGHSLGEFGAAAVARVFSERDGMHLVSERGKLMQNLPLKGGYAVVMGELSEVIEIVAPFMPDVVVGGVNGPHLTVVTGKAEWVDKILEECDERGMSSRRLNVSLPFHSPLMMPMLDAFGRYCATFTFKNPQIAWSSTMTGQRIRSDKEADASYWMAQIVEPVRFWAAMLEVTDSKPSVMLEIGPGKTLIGMAKQAIDEDNHIWISSLDPKCGDIEALRKAAISLSALGVPLNLSQMNEDCDRCGC